MARRGALHKGQVIDDTYEVLFYIGEGAFGEVYRVQHKYLGIQVLKLLKEDFEKSANLGEITREARLLAKVTHQNIVRVFEANVFELEGKKRHFVTMGFVSGETLTQLLARRMHLPRAEAVGLMIDVLSGLAHVHAMTPPLIHRDINADNILLSYEGKAPVGLLSDFGLAQALDINEHLPGAAGRYPYMAPECFWGAYLLTSDVFSAGVVLYKAITGLHPWQYELDWVDEDPETVVTEVTRARKSKPRPPSFHLDDQDEALDAIVLKAIERDLERRYLNAGEFLAALEAWRSGAQPRARATQPAKPAMQPYAPHNAGAGLDKVAGMHELKETLHQDIIRPLLEPELYAEYGVTPPNGILLVGPPGCGKTFVARCLAEEVRRHFIEVKPSTLASIYIHGTQEKTAALFKEAEEKAPTLLFFDEIDAVVPTREGQSNQHHASEVNEFLAQMTECAQRGIFIVAATNRPEKVDPAILRTGRIDKVVYLGPPDIFAREEMLRLHLLGRPVASDLDANAVAGRLDGYVSSDVKFIVNEASRLALKDKAKIGLVHFAAVLSKHQPSISRAQLKAYERFAHQRTFTDE